MSHFFTLVCFWENLNKVLIFRSRMSKKSSTLRNSCTKKLISFLFHSPYLNIELQAPHKNTLLVFWKSFDLLKILWNTFDFFYIIFTKLYKTIRQFCLRHIWFVAFQVYINSMKFIHLRCQDMYIFWKD